MFGTIGLTSFFALPLLGAFAMVGIGAGTVLAPSVLLLLPFMLARVG